MIEEDVRNGIRTHLDWIRKLMNESEEMGELDKSTIREAERQIREALSQIEEVIK